MPEQTISEPGEPWRLIIGLEKPYEIPDTNRVVNNISLSVAVGKGPMAGRSWVRVDWGKENLSLIDAVGYGFDGTILTSLIDGTPANDPIATQIQAYLEKHPDAVENLKEELSKKF